MNNSGKPTPLFAVGGNAGQLICPHCDRALSAHERPCAGRFTRRFLFGLFAGATAAMAIPDVWGTAELMQCGTNVKPGDYIFSSDGHPIRFSTAKAFLPPREAEMFSLAGTGSVVPPVPAWSVFGQWSHGCSPDEYIVRNPVVPFWKRK